jgi:hypothetical protein
VRRLCRDGRRFDDARSGDGLRGRGLRDDLDVHRRGRGGRRYLDGLGDGFGLRELAVACRIDVDGW